MFHTMHEPSTLPEMSSSPLGDQLRSYTSAQCPRSAHTGPQLPPPLSRHSITIPSSPADASVPPDGSHRTAFTGFAWPLRSCTNDTASPDCAPTFTRHSRTSLSEPPVARSPPFETSTESTGSRPCQEI